VQQRPLLLQVLHLLCQQVDVWHVVSLDIADGWRL
jgi:hypothetical protein